jgi:hypothetical protein
MDTKLSVDQHETGLRTGEILHDIEVYQPGDQLWHATWGGRRDHYFGGLGDFVE